MEHERETDTPGGPADDPDTDTVGTGTSETPGGNTERPGDSGEGTGGDEQEAGDSAITADAYPVVALESALAAERPQARAQTFPSADTGTAATPQVKEKRRYAPRAPRVQNIPSIDVLTSTLLVLHTSIALMAKDDIWQIDEAEARQLSTASQALLKEYGGSVSTRTLAWTNFGMAMASVYGMRLLAVTAERKRRVAPRAATERPAPPVDTPFDKVVQQRDDPPLPGVHYAGRHG